jgi:signal transduction histidine kinase
MKKAPKKKRAVRKSKRVDKLGLLPQVAQIFNAKLDPHVVLELVLVEAVKRMRATSGSLCLINPNDDVIEIEVAIGLPPEAKKLRLRLGQGITGWVALHGKPVRIANVSKDPRYVPVRSGVRSELAVPLEIEGTVAGVLNVDSNRVAHFTRDDEDLLLALASQASKLIQNAWLYEQVNKKAAQLETLFSIAETILSQTTLDDVLMLITRETCELMGASLCALFLLDDEGNSLVQRALHGTRRQVLEAIVLPVEDSRLGVAINSRKPVYLPDARKSDTFEHMEMAEREGLVSMLAVPLLAGKEALGVLTVYTDSPHRFSNEEIKLLSTLANYSAIAIQRARLHEQTATIEEQLRQKERLSTLGLLAAEFSHEIRNPLTVMKMLLHSLAKTIPEDPQSRKDLDIIMQKIDQLNETTERVLRFSRSSEPKLENVDLNDVVNEVVLLTRHQFRQSRIQIFCALSAEPPLVGGDRLQLEQALLNLVLNAAQALAEDRRIFLSTLILESEGRCSLEVRDTGKGIEKEKKEKLFQPFFSNKTGGTGLGLPIVKKIVDHHGGEIHWESSESGTSFKMLFPRREGMA